MECSCADRGLCRIQMCVHGKCKSVLQVSGLCELNAGMNQDRHLCPPSSHGLPHLICQWSIFTPAAVCECETMSASMYVHNRPPYLHSFTLACMSVCCTVLWNVCKIFEVWCGECLHIPAWVIRHCSSTSPHKNTLAQSIHSGQV